MSSTMPRTDGTARRTFRAMGTDVLFALDAPAGDQDAASAFDRAEHELRRLEHTFSRFDETSELRRLEQRRAMIVSDELRTVVKLALDARRRSAGRFDPTILPSLRALGYDRSIEHVRGQVAGTAAVEHRPGAVMVNDRTGIIALGEGVALDLGGIAKGWITDRLAELLATTAPALVDCGGDVSCTPRAEDRPWSVAVDGLGVQPVLRLAAGGIATSGVDRRRWCGPVNGQPDRHHVVDPATGASARTDLVRVTVVAGSCAAAEAASTSMLIGGASMLGELGDAFDVAWLARPADAALPDIRSKEL